MAARAALLLLVYSCVAQLTTAALTFSRPTHLHSSQISDVIAEHECESGNYPPTSDRSVPTYIIDLDLPPEYRYCKLMEDKGPALVKVLDIIRNETSGLFDGKLFAVVEQISKVIGKYLPYPFYDEIKGIATAADMPEGDVTLLNIMYEIYTVCTSIIAQNPDGKLYHVRNLDFGLFLGWDKVNNTWLVSEALRPLTVILDYRRNNVTVFKSAGFAGMVGVLTGIRPDAFTLTIDERFTLKPGLWYMLKWATGAEVQWNTVITRQVLENTTDYLSAQKALTSTPLIAPVYFILGGKEAPDGCVITRDQNKSDIWPLGAPSLSQQSLWYLLQTNYDHWKRPPFFDNRRDPGIDCMDKTGQQNITLPALFDVLSTKPTRNKLTVYSALMDVAEGHVEAWLQSCPEPGCVPW